VKFSLEGWKSGIQPAGWQGWKNRKMEKWKNGRMERWGYALPQWFYKSLAVCIIKSNLMPSFTGRQAHQPELRVKMMESSLPVYPPKEGWQGWKKNGRMKEWYNGKLE
jgi:hypothetical protein